MDARAAARRAMRSLATVGAAFLILSLFFIQARYLVLASGLVPLPRAEAQVEVQAPAADGSRTIAAEYCSEVIAGRGGANPAGRTSTPLTFNDAWMHADAHVYHHGLAAACAVLAAVCNSESQFYGNVEGAKPYAELALGALGFEDVRTDSYALRSSVFDEVGALFVGAHDVAAYTLASKTIPGGRGEPPTTLVFVGIRGSYGIEWLSNFNFMNPADADHQGFKAAEREVEAALFQYARERGADPAHTRVLITGHSRGGAIANLLAARLDALSETPQALAPACGIFAYTFAAPCATKAADRDDAAYGNVFNIVNEADIVPQLPLSIWGYGRYGIDVSLPAERGGATPGSYGAMQNAYWKNTGAVYHLSDRAFSSLSSFEAQMARSLPNAESLANPAGVFGVLQTLAGLDYAAAIDAHCPDAYIAWMQATDASDLALEGAAPCGAAPESRPAEPRAA